MSKSPELEHLETRKFQCAEIAKHFRISADATDYLKDIRRIERQHIKILRWVQAEVARVLRRQ